MPPSARPARRRSTPRPTARLRKTATPLGYADAPEYTANIVADALHGRAAQHPGHQARVRPDDMAYKAFDLTGQVAPDHRRQRRHRPGLRARAGRAGSDIAIWGTNPDKNAAAVASLPTPAGACTASSATWATRRRWTPPSPPRCRRSAVWTAGRQCRRAAATTVFTDHQRAGVAPRHAHQPRRRVHAARAACAAWSSAAAGLWWPRPRWPR